MTGKNRYVKMTHISIRKFRELLKYFCADIPALTAADVTGLNRNTVNRFYKLFRIRIMKLCEQDSPFAGSVDMDESYFGARRVRGKRGRGAQGKTIVFGLLKRGDKVYTQIVPDVKRSTLMQVIDGKVDKNSVMYTDGFRTYDGLVDWGYKHHYRVNHGADEFVEKGNPSNHINGIESFWGYAKNRQSKISRCTERRLQSSSKRSEFRFNMRGQNMYKYLLKEFRNNPLN